MAVLTKRGGFLERQGDGWGKRSGFGEVVEVAEGKNQLNWLKEHNVDLHIYKKAGLYSQGGEEN